MEDQRYKNRAETAMVAIAMGAAAIAWAVLLFFVVLALVPQAKAADFSVTRSYVRPVLIYTADKPGFQNGSMVVIRKGYALTARHAVTAAGDVGILSLPTGNNTSEVLEVVAGNQFLDLAVVRGNFDCPCAPMGRAPAVDDTVVAVGFPNYHDFRSQWLSLGLVQRTTFSQLVHSANTAPGMSGGGVFAEQNGAWVLVGISIAIANSRTTRQELNWVGFARSVRSIRGFLADVKELTQ